MVQLAAFDRNPDSQVSLVTNIAVMVEGKRTAQAPAVGMTEQV
jgi:hypothetical protein